MTGGPSVTVSIILANTDTGRGRLTHLFLKNKHPASPPSPFTITPHPCQCPDLSPIDCPTGDAASPQETGGRGKLIVMRHAHVMDEGMPFATISEHGDEGGQHPTHDAADDESLHER